MAVDRKSVTIHYRRLADDAILGGRSLEETIRAAMALRQGASTLAQKASLRVYDRADDSLLVNLYHDNRPQGFDLVMGDIVHFTPGHLQALLDMGQLDGPLATVEQLPAPQRREYVHSLMHWMVKGNHAFLIQSTSLKTDTLEEYLAWLIGPKTNTVPGAPPIILDAKFNEDEVGGDLEDIQEVVIGGAVRPEPVAAALPVVDGQRPLAQDVEQHQQVGVRRFTGWGAVWSVLEQLLGGPDKVQNLKETVPDDAELSVEVHIGYKTKKRKVDRTALKQLERGLRNVPDSQIHVIGKGGARTVDGKIRLHHNAAIKLLKVRQADGEERVGSLLDPSDVLRAMVEAYQTFEANGKIAED